MSFILLFHNIAFVINCNLVMFESKFSCIHLFIPQVLFFSKISRSLFDLTSFCLVFQSISLLHKNISNCNHAHLVQATIRSSSGLYYIIFSVSYFTQLSVQYSITMYGHRTVGWYKCSAKLAQPQQVARWFQPRKLHKRVKINILQSMSENSRRQHFYSVWL